MMPSVFVPAVCVKAMACGREPALYCFRRLFLQKMTKGNDMRVFNCTVKDLAFRRKAIDDITSSMAANGYQDARADYMVILGHWNDALNCASMKTGSEKSRIALRYLSGNITIDRISDLEFYNNRTVRRYIREFCECVRTYYLERFDIALAAYC